LARDVLLGFGWLVLRNRLRRVRVVHRAHGKLASVLLFVLLVLLTANVTDAWITPLVWTITVIVVLSTADYTRDGIALLRGANDQT
jgi:hypothetical protein